MHVRVVAFRGTAQLSTVLQQMEDLKALNRVSSPEALLERYSRVRLALLDVRAQHPGLTPARSRMIQDAVLLLADLEHALDMALELGQPRAEFAEANSRIAEALDRLVGLLRTLEDEHLGGSRG